MDPIFGEMLGEPTHFLAYPKLSYARTVIFVHVYYSRRIPFYQQPINYFIVIHLISF